MHIYVDTITGKTVKSLIELENLKPSVIKTQQVPKDSNILVIRRALGDTLMLFPALEMWWKDRKKPNLTFATDYWLIELAQRQKFITRVTDFKTVIKEEFDEIYWLEGEVDFLPINKRKHRTLLFADRLYEIWSEQTKGEHSYNKNKISVKDYFKLTRKERKHAKNMLLQHGWDGKTPLIALGPMTKSQFRSWSKETTLMSILPDYKFVILHDKRIDDINFHNAINLTGMTNIFELAGILKTVDMALVPDSGIMHVAAQVGTPTIAIFGRVIPPRNRIAYYKNVIPIESSCPFTKTYCYDSQFNNCSNTDSYRQCMEIITPEFIVERIKKLIKNV